jgi:hypothetical protein
VVVSVTPARTDYHYDLWVPGPACYAGSGAVHHNSGKTYAVKMAAVAFALGGDHPAVMAWLEDNDLPRDLIPDGPGTVILAAPSASTSIAFHRRDVQALLPATGWESWSLNVPAEARIEIAVPGYDRPAIIYFKSVDQGHQKFKGSETRLVVISEEPEGEEGRLVLDECMRGCSSIGGRVVIECTPQAGMTWVYDDLYVKRKFGCAVLELDTTHNVMLPDYASTMRWLDSLTEEERAMRQRGQFVDRRGLIYTGWTRGTGDRYGPGMLCAPFEIPKEWPRFRGADFGLVDAMAVPYAALGDDDTLYVYWLYYEPNGISYEWHAEQIVARQPAGETYEGSWGDPSAAEVMNDWAALDLYFDLANREVDAGLSGLMDRMRLRGDGRPRLKVFDIPELRPLVTEIENYRWDTNSKRPKPVKKNDHALDALRYLDRGIEEWRGL